MSAGTSGPLLLSALTIVANGFFVAVELALVRVRPSRIRSLARAGSRRAQIAEKLVMRLDETLSTCQVGITLASLALGWLGEPAFAALLEPLFEPASGWLGPMARSLSVATAFFAITFLHVVIGELVPKSVSISAAEKTALALAPALWMVRILLWPLVFLLNRVARWILRPLRLKPPHDETDPTLDELKGWITRSMERGALGTVQAGLLDNLLRFSQLRARDVMVPRSRIAAIDARDPWPKVARQIADEGYSRYLLHSGDIDHQVSILHLKTLTPYLLRNETVRDLPALATPAQVVPESLPLERLLTMMRVHRAQMVVVADEYGTTVGLVTLEDVIEELVGEVRDEFDQEEVDQIRPRPGGGWTIDPTVPVSRLSDLVATPPELRDDVHTVAGLLQTALGRIPTTGDEVTFGSAWRLCATIVHGTRIVEVALLPVPDRSLAPERDDR